MSNLFSNMSTEWQGLIILGGICLITMISSEIYKSLKGN